MIPKYENKLRFNLQDNEEIIQLKNCNDYFITNYGRLYSNITNTYLKGNIDRNGYLYIVIRINNKNVTVKPHRLVAEYFISNPNKKLRFFRSFLC